MTVPWYGWLLIGLVSGGLGLALWLAWYFRDISR